MYPGVCLRLIIIIAGNTSLMEDNIHICIYVSSVRRSNIR